MTFTILLRAALILMLHLAPARAEDVTVFAASSLKTALDTALKEWPGQAEHNIAVSYAGSSVLARQIEAGAPADLFISAHPVWIDYLDERGLVQPDGRKDLFGNTIVMISSEPLAPFDVGADTDLTALLEDGRFAMALTNSVPAGIYGRQALAHFGLWDELSPHVAQADNVRAALALVAIGEAPLGIVYATDAQAEPSVHIVGKFPPGAHDPIIYPGAVLTSAGSVAATDLLMWLSSPEAGAIFKAQGFTLLGA